MKIILVNLILAGFFLLSSCVQSQINPQGDTTEITESKAESDSFPILERMNQKALALKTYLKNNNTYNQKVAILIDMKQHSGKCRMYVYDLDSMKILSKGLVAHGSGSETGNSDSLIFSNIPNSYMTSLGKYKIGAAYIGAFGRSYKLHGLEASNNKAYERAVVFHRYSCVPDDEQDYEICNSLGCPMVSEKYFEEIDKIISNSRKPILMEIFY